MLLAVLLAVQDPAALVEQLGSEDIEARQCAEGELVRLGAAAEPALELGSRHADREVAARAARILLDVVAPHRREARAELDHLRAHLKEAVARKRSQDVVALMDALRRLDPAHPLLADFSLQVGEWEGCLISAQDLRRAIDAARDFGRPPTREDWAARGREIREAVASTPSPGPCAPCARWRMSTVKVGLMFENARAEDVLAHLRDVGGLTIVLADEEGGFDHALTVSAKDVTLAEALDRVLGPYGRAGRVTVEGVVLVERRPEPSE